MSHSGRISESSARLLATPSGKRFEAGWKWIVAEADVSTRTDRLEDLACSLEIGDVPAVLTFLSAQEDSSLKQVLQLRLLQRWAEVKPQAAANWLLKSFTGPLRAQAISDVATLWVNQDPEEALAWMRHFGDPADQFPALRAIAYEIARAEPSDALSLAMELPKGQAQDELIVHAVREWAAVNPRAAAEWTRKMEPGRVRERITAAIATAWGKTDPAAAATLALELLPPGRTQDGALLGIVQRWGSDDPASAAAWVVQFPPGELRDTALENLVNSWADRDLEQVGDWLSDTDLGESKSTLMRAYARKLTPQHPAMAAQWAEHITDRNMRAQTIEMVLQAWMLRDGNAAREWIGNATLSPETKRRLGLGDQ